MGVKDSQQIGSPSEDRIADLVNIRVNVLGCEGINSIEESNGHTVLVNLGGHKGVATIYKKSCSKEASAIYKIAYLVNIPDKYKIQENDYIKYNDKKRVPFNIELASDAEIAKFINKEQLLKFIEMNGIICNDENTVNVYDKTEGFRIVIERQYDYEKLCIKILLLYSSMQLLSACSNNHLFGNVKKIQIVNALGLFIYFNCKNSKLSCGIPCQLLHSYYVDETLEGIIRLAMYESFRVHSKELKRIALIFDEQIVDINLVAEDWFSYCSYELILLWKFVKSGATLKQCANPNCGASFPPLEHGNERYCPACIKNRRQITYSSEERHEHYMAKKTGVTINEYRAQKLAEKTNQKTGGKQNGNS